MKWENGEKEKGAEEKKEGMEELSRIRLSCESVPRAYGRQDYLSCMLRELLITVQR